MKKILFASILATAVGCAGSAPTSDSLESLQAKQVDTNAAFTLERGESASLDGGALVITFVEVAADSRCPADVVCVWQGDAAMVFQLSSRVLRIAARLDTLHTGVDPRTGSYAGYSIAVTELAPYPHSSDDPAARDYRATLTVTRQGQ